MTQLSTGRLAQAMFFAVASFLMASPVDGLGQSGEIEKITNPVRVSENDTNAEKQDATDADEKTILFDGKTLEGWEPTNFGGEGDCRVVDGKLMIETGHPLSGVTSTLSEIPKTNYELSLEVQRTSGIDFFCGLTFPVADSHCSLIVGGWAGAVVGLSCIDRIDAAHNESRKLMKFEKNRWYKIKVRVQPKRIAAWIDDDQVIDQDIVGKELSVRGETLPSRPLGICNFETTSEFRNIRLVRLPATEHEAPATKDEKIEGENIEGNGGAENR